MVKKEESKITSICCSCGNKMGTKRAGLSNLTERYSCFNQLISHGLCKSCEHTFIEQIKDRKPV